MLLGNRFHSTQSYIDAEEGKPLTIALSVLSNIAATTTVINAEKDGKSEIGHGGTALFEHYAGDEKTRRRTRKTSRKSSIGSTTRESPITLLRFKFAWTINASASLTKNLNFYLLPLYFSLLLSASPASLALLT